MDHTPDVLYANNEPESVATKILSLPLRGSGHQPNTWFLGHSLPESHVPSISIGSAVLQSSRMQTRGPRYVYNNREQNARTQPFNGPFSGTTWVSRYQKYKTNLDYTERSKRQ